MNHLSLLLLSLTFLASLAATAMSQPRATEVTQWKPSLQRPTKDWDFDGQRVLGHIDHDIGLWDAATGQLRLRLKGHDEQIHKVQFSPDGTHAISSSWISPGPMLPYRSQDTRTILWNLATGQAVRQFPGQVAGEFRPDGKQLVTFSVRPSQPSSFDATVWEVPSGRKVAQAKLADGSTPYWDQLHFLEQGDQFVDLNTRGATLFDSQTGRHIRQIDVPYGILQLTRQGTLVGFDLGKEQGTIYEIDLASGQVLHRFEHGLKLAWKGAWRHDGSKLATFPTQGRLEVWDIKSGHSVTGAPAGEYPQHVAIVSPDNARLAIVWGGSHVENQDIPAAFGLYDANTATEIAVTSRDLGSRLIGFSPDSKTLALLGKQLQIYQADDGKHLRSVTLEQLREIK